MSFLVLRSRLLSQTISPTLFFLFERKACYALFKALCPYSLCPHDLFPSFLYLLVLDSASRETVSSRHGFQTIWRKVELLSLPLSPQSRLLESNCIDLPSPTHSLLPLRELHMPVRKAVLSGSEIRTRFLTSRPSKESGEVTITTTARDTNGIETPLPTSLTMP